MKTRTLYTNQTKNTQPSTLDTIGMVFAMVMLFIVLPIALCIITAGF